MLSQKKHQFVVVVGFSIYLAVLALSCKHGMFVVVHGLSYSEACGIIAP